MIAYNKGDLTVAIKQYKEVLSNKPSPQETQAAVTGLEEIYMNDLGKPDEYLAILENFQIIKPMIILRIHYILKLEKYDSSMANMKKPLNHLPPTFKSFLKGIINQTHFTLGQSPVQF